MRAIIATICSILWCSSAAAQMGGSFINVINPQVRGPVSGIYDDFQSGGGGTDIIGGVCSEWGHQVPCNNHYAITRASAKYCQTLGAIWVSVASGLNCITNQGYFLEETKTNSSLWSRDMTNAAWVKVNMTNALDAIGIDGVANSATTLTAAAGNATILQTLVLGSTAENYSVWLKGITVTGNIQITLNNLIATTNCTVSTTAFTRCTTTSTLANPIIGIRIVNSGDSVVADFNQLEAGSFATSPILTTTVAVARASDVSVAKGTLLTLLQSAVASVVIKNFGAANSNNNMLIARGTNSYLRMNSNTGIIEWNNTADLSATVGGSKSFISDVIKSGFSWDTGAAARSIVAANGTVATAATTPGTANADAGPSPALPLAGNIYLQSITGFNYRPSDTVLQGLTQ